MGQLIVFVKCRDFFESTCWQTEEDIPIDALRHFRGRNGELSIYRVASGDDVPRLIAAFALAHTDRLESKDFIVVEEAAVETLGLTTNVTPGAVPDVVASSWHRDILHHDEHDVRRLAHTFAKRGQCHRVTLGAVKDLVRMAHDLKHYESNSLNPAIQAQLAKVLIDAPDACERCGHRKSAHTSHSHVVTCSICKILREVGAS